MSEAQFYTFLTGGLALAIALLTLVAWNLWRMREEASAGRASALEGVAHELRINLQRMISELSQVAHHPGVGPDVLLPIRSPQLDGVNRSLINTNRNGIAVLGSTYQEMEARKLGLRAVLAQGRAPETELDDAMDAAINGIAALYIWEVHKGALPAEIGRVRSWSVRDWMKAKNFRADAFPGMHLRDEVVERLRLYGLALTPRPLTMTAWEYYSMQYDRHADARGPLGRRRAEKAEKAEKEKPAGKGGLFGLGRKKEEEVYEEDEVADLTPAAFDPGPEEDTAAQQAAYQEPAPQPASYGNTDEQPTEELESPAHDHDPQRTN
ncbi:MAG: hypothetical protein C0456_05055 [Hyphomonas sp.]|uniref:hypothetical protein n=1 Tax=Hyphomonas sp. TaxID=87 RepID=UPI001E12D1AA|nr:hypothetical protein [Hyphomonas sp.]MBA4225982.1 hypothetical protein [Hyphomonas sp.]